MRDIAHDVWDMVTGREVSMSCLLRLAYVFLVMTVGEAEGPFQTANLIKAAKTLGLIILSRPPSRMQWQNDQTGCGDSSWMTWKTSMTSFGG